MKLETKKEWGTGHLWINRLKGHLPSETRLKGRAAIDFSQLKSHLN